MKRLRQLALLLAALISAGTTSPASAEVQRLEFLAPGWHFVSLGVRPLDPDPLSVFPVGAGFAYDHLWSFDPDGGWRHFSPLPEIPSLLNDLKSVEPLAGYWIHVTRVPNGGAELAVEGPRAITLRIEAPQTPVESWHPVGPLLAAGRAGDNVETVFAALGEALEDSILEVWRHDSSADRLEQITDFDASCAGDPDSCLNQGRAYWLRTDGNIILGPRLEAVRRQIVLTGDNPIDLIQVRYEGAGAVAARLRARDSSAGVIFFAASEALVDGVGYPEVDTAGDPAGPDTEADFDGDQSDEPCPDLCTGLTGCVNLCFANGGQTHSLFAGIDLETLSSLQTFSSTDPGREHTKLLLEVIAASDDALLPAGAVPLPQQEPGAADEIALAVKPAVLRGVYAGVFIYEEPDSAEIPFTLWLDDCVRDPNSGEENCSGNRAVGLLNPTLLGSATNGIDDDDDGDIDEPDEADKPIPTRESAGFAPETALRGETSANKQRLRLMGGNATPPELDFARGRCLSTNVCFGSGNACGSDADCPPIDGGIASAFVSATREISLDGRRVAPAEFEGFFTDRYSGTSLGDSGETAASGRFILTRVGQSECVSPSDTPGVRPRVVGQGCFQDSDCPGRCTGHPALDGFACFADSDCVGNFSGSPISGFCDPFLCVFSEPAALCSAGTGGGFAGKACQSNANCPGGSCDKSDSRKALDHVDTALVISDLDRNAFAILSGPTELRGLITPATGGSLDFANIDCGTYEIRILAPGCVEAVVEDFQPCTDLPPVVSLDCPGSPDTPLSIPPGSTADSLLLLAGASLLDGETATGGDEEELELHATAGEAVGAGEDPVFDWTNLLTWPGAIAEIRAGLLEIF